MAEKIGNETQSVYRGDMDRNGGYTFEQETADGWFDYANELAARKDMRGAVNALSRAIALEPTCGIYYRWRGHRHLNCGDVEDACADLTMASRLIPDNWDVWYHLALTCVVLGRHEYAEYAHQRCWSITRDTTNDSKSIALCNWMWINRSLMGKTKEADKLLQDYIRSDMDAGEDEAYLRMCLAYKNDIEPESLLVPKADDDEPTLNVMTQAFGLANYYRIKGFEKKYRETINFIVSEGKAVWNCFGYASATYIQNHMKEA